MSEQPSTSTRGLASAPRDVWLGRLEIAAAALLWSTSGFFAKAPMFAHWPGPLLAFWRALFASVLLVPNVRKPRWSWRLLPMVGCFAAMNYTYLTAMATSEASVAIWLQNTAPVWVFLASVLWLHEPVQPRDWLLLAIASLGVGIILFSELHGVASSGVFYGLIAGATYAGVVVMLRRLSLHDPFWLVSLNMVGTACLLAPIALTYGIWPHGSQWVYLVGFGMLQMGAPYVLFARGLKTVPSHEAAGIALVEPLLVPLWVYIAWHNEPSYQAPTWWTIVGGACILVGLMIRLWSPPSRRSQGAVGEEKHEVHGE